MLPGSRKESGMTLVELLVALAVAMLLLSAGIPGFTTLTRNNRLVASANTLAGLLGEARSESVSQRRTVSVCGSSAGTSCDAAWATGAVAFLDADADGVIDTGEAVLRQISNPVPSVTIALSGPTTVRYTSMGWLAANSAGTFRFCDARGNRYARALLLSSTGRVSTATDTDSPADGIVDDAGGSNISCP
jgi:type IV fimbrial biogenesis protein FimT